MRLINTRADRLARKTSLLCSFLFGIACFGIVSSAACADPVGKQRLGFCYNVTVPARDLAAFDVLVVDSAYPQRELNTLKKRGAVVFAYLSLGAVDENRSWAGPLKAAGVLGEQNPGFSSRQIDLSKPIWGKLLKTRVVPDLVKQGYDGLFLDDLDLIYQNKQQAEVVKLIAMLKQSFPKLKLMANRGLEYSTLFAKDVDYLLLESCFALEGKMRPAGDPAWAIGHLDAAKKKNPQLIGCGLDYFADKAAPISPAIQTLIDHIRKAHEQAGLMSVISTKDLQTVPITRDDSESN